MSVDPNYEFVEPLPTLNPAGNYALRGREISSGSAVTILLLPIHSRESIMGDINSLPPERRSAILKVGEWHGMMFVVSAYRTEEAAAKQAPAEPLTPKVLSRAGVWKVPSSVSSTSGITPPQPPPSRQNAAPIPKPGEVSGFTALPPDPAKPAASPTASKDGPGEFTLMFQPPARAQENAKASPQTTSPVDRSPLLGEVTLTTEPSVFQNQPPPVPTPFPSADVTVEASALHKPVSPAAEPGEFTRMFQTSVRPSQQGAPRETLAPPPPAPPPPTSAEPGEFTQMFLKPRAEPPVARAAEPPPAPQPASRAAAANAPGEFTQLFPTSASTPSPTPAAVEVPKLLVEGRDGTHTLMPLDKPQLILGRSEAVELSYPDDNRLSREHLKLTRSGDQWFVEDLRSKNGSFLNGRMISEKTLFNRGDLITAGRISISFQVPPSEVETVTFAPAAQPPAHEQSDFMRLFQPGNLSNTNGAVQAPLPPPPEPSAPPGGFTQLFQALPPTPPKVQPPTAPPTSSRPLSDNDATRLFDVKPKPAAAKRTPAPPPAPANPPGEFTQMFQAPSRPSPQPFPAASAPPPARPTTPAQPGEFTRIMESPMAPPAFRPGAPAPAAYVPPPIPPKQQAGEFTRMFGVGKGDSGPIAQPPPPSGSGATGVFSAPQQPSYSAPQGPSEFTRMFSVPSPEPSAPKPPAPAAPAPVAPVAGPSPKLMIILLAVFAVLAVIIVVVFALRK